MSQSERRLPRVAVGFAMVALATVVVALIVTWRGDRLRSDAHGAPVSRHVSASDLAKLKPGAVGQVDGGIRVTDATLSSALGLTPADTIVAISGRPVTRVP